MTTGSKYTKLGSVCKVSIQISTVFLNLFELVAIDANGQADY